MAKSSKLLKLKLKKGNFMHYILVIAAVFLGLFLLSKLVGNVFTERFSGNATLYFFYADWCPHCTKVKPTWSALENENLGVSLEKVDCSDRNNVPELAKQYNVGGFPTIMLVNNGNVQEYSGNRSKEDIMAFVNSNV